MTTRTVETVDGSQLRTGDRIRHYAPGTGSTVVEPLVRVCEGPHAPNGRAIVLTYEDGHAVRTWAMDHDTYERVSADPEPWRVQHVAGHLPGARWWAD